MQVIPSINVPDLAAALARIQQARLFASWVHIDVGDGIFTPHVTWGNPLEFAASRSQFLPLLAEVHLMLETPEDAVISWAEAGVKRVIVHTEADWNFERLQEVCANYSVELGLALAPETSVEEIDKYLTTIEFYQILGVIPGRPGQQFQDQMLTKVRSLRQEAPDVTIEVDGGMTLAVARLAKEAGADIAVSASYIFNHPDPAAAYRELAAI